MWLPGFLPEEQMIRASRWTAPLALAVFLLHPAAGARTADAGAPASAPAAAAAPSAAASASAPAEPPGQGTEYTEKGADTCLSCHDPESDSPGFNTAAIFKTAHAQRGNAHAPFGMGNLQCEACHGPGAKHAARGSNKKATINNFKSTSFLPVQQRNDTCLGCHQDQVRNAWHGGAHDRSQVACTSCHQLHTDHDVVRDKVGQADVCYTCHKQERADFQKTSSHPVRFGLMACSACHNAHGSSSTAMLVKTSVNQTCFSCHAEKRGPLLWEHAPVVEDCTLCHTAHGSAHRSLLSKTPPLLCQQCHSQAGHPSVARTPAGLPSVAGGGGTGAVYLVGGSCTNCHTQVHGSNHPSGAKLLR
jgi:DmsE family decaheme c-type cytochrome